MRNCKYPPCACCKKTPRPEHREKYVVAKMPHWICAKCRSNSRSNTTREWEYCKYPKCVVCKLHEVSHLSISEYEKRRGAGDVEEQYTCVNCKDPPCACCKKTRRPEHREKYTVAKMPRWTCPKCLKHSTLCMFCGEGTQASAFHTKEL